MLPLWRCPLRRGLFALAGLTLALAVPRFVAASIVVPATLDELAGEAPVSYTHLTLPTILRV